MSDGYDEFTVQAGDNILAQISATANAILAAQKEVEDKEEELRVAQNVLRNLEETVMVELMKDAGQQKLTTSDGILVEIKDIFRGTPTKENESKAFTWMRENGQGSLIKSEIKADLGKATKEEVAKVSKAMFDAGAKPITKEAVHHQTLAAMVRELLGRGDSVPLDILGVTKIVKADVKPGK